MCKPLKGKIRKDVTNRIRFEFDDVKSAVDFYKKYRDVPSALEYDYPNLREDLKYFFNEEHTNVIRKNDYNDWLFNYCFGDVTK